MAELLPHDLPHLRLRALRAVDLDAFHAYRSDPRVARYQGWAPMTKAEAAAFLDAQAGPPALVRGGWRQWAIAERAGDRLLGDVGVWLAADARQAGFGLSIAPVAQGRGHGGECVRGLLALLFAATPVEEVEASTDARNAPCLAMLARAGMRHVRTQQASYKGEACIERVFVARRPEGERRD